MFECSKLAHLRAFGGCFCSLWSFRTFLNWFRISSFGFRISIPDSVTGSEGRQAYSEVVLASILSAWGRTSDQPRLGLPNWVMGLKPRRCRPAFSFWTSSFGILLELDIR